MAHGQAHYIKWGYIAVPCALSTLFFLLQHRFEFSWDFSVYVLNARYWLGDGGYYEPSRPPLMPFILALLSPFGREGVEYAYIILVCLLYLYAMLRLGAILGIKAELFYLFSLTPFVLRYGLVNGTELLSLSFLSLSISEVISRRSRGAVFLGLACLARYSFLVYLPLLLFCGRPRNVILCVAAFSLTMLPFLAYNLIASGNLFTSFADFYALNVKYRDYIRPQTTDAILIAAAVFGAAILMIKLRVIRFSGGSLRFSGSERAIMTLFAVYSLTLLSFYETPLKDVRYLLPLTIPVAYLLACLVADFSSKSRAFLAAVLILFALSHVVAVAILPQVHVSRGEFAESLSVISGLGLDGLSTRSNAYPYLNYLGKTSGYYPRQELVGWEIEHGSIVVIYYGFQEPEWSTNRTFIAGYPLIYEDAKFIILGNVSKTRPQEKVDETYLERIRRHIYLTHNYSINTNPCLVLFESQPFLEASCNLINLKGFTRDENRNTR